jgi:hypothetical protein
MTATPVTATPRLHRDSNGREAFYGLVRSWINRSGWSFRAMAELCEVAMRHDLAPGVGDWQETQLYEQGDAVAYDGHIWIAEEATRLVPSTASSQWRRGPAVRRVHTSQLHKISHGAVQLVNADIFDALGTLNLYLAELRRKEADLPGASKLAEDAARGLVLEDADGPLGPEELFAIYIGRMQPPIAVTLLSERQASELSRALAKRLRIAVTQAGLDLVEDWAKLAELHPSGDKVRLRKLREITLGMGHWSADQIRDEEFAVNALIQKLTGLTHQEDRVGDV